MCQNDAAATTSHTALILLMARQIFMFPLYVYLYNVPSRAVVLKVCYTIFNVRNAKKNIMFEDKLMFLSSSALKTNNVSLCLIPTSCYQRNVKVIH